MTDCATVARQLGEVVEDGYLPRSCCWSCHDDAEQGYHPLSSVELPDGSWVSVCCRQAAALEEAGGSDDCL